MNYTLSSADGYIIKNIELLQEVWKESCEAIENDLKGDYSRNLLLILNDLREEIDNNKDHFSKNAYAKKFFEIQIATYCTIKQDQSDELNKTKKLWTEDVHEELNFIVESLSDKNTQIRFQLEDIPILIQRIEEKLISENSFELIIQILDDKLRKKNTNFDQISFLTQTLILLFNSKGILEVKSILDDLFEEFHEIENSVDYRGYYEFLELGDNCGFYPKLWGSPLRNGKPIQEYIEEVKSYYESLDNRLNLLKNIYSQAPQTYKVIFNIIGVSFTQNFNIGKIHFYITQNDDQSISKYINETSQINQNYSRYFSTSSDPIKFESRTQYCVAVDIQAIDNKFIAIEAKQIAERTIAALSTRTRKRNDQPIKLSNDWVICNSQGEIQNISFPKVAKTVDINVFTDTSQNDYRQKLYRWISSESRCHPTVVKWLSSVDWYRQAIESSESSQEILNSWFAVEQFSEDSKILDYKILSKQVNTIYKKFPQKNNLQEIIDLWIGGDGIKTVQLLLVLSELKFDLYNQIKQLRDIFSQPLISDTLRVSECIDSNLQEYLSKSKDETEFLDRLIQKLPDIKTQLNNKNKAYPVLDEVHKIFYNNDECKKYLVNKIFELKDDVYNIYRIRNMLVHYGSTKSKLLDYYAKRSIGYCHSLLDAISYKIYQTSSDDEIMPLEFYFREMVIDANIALEAVKDNKMDKFRHWALS